MQAPPPDPGHADANDIDADVVRRVRAGDSAELERIFRAHYAPLCDFVHRYVRSRETAEELVQDVFFNIWTNRDRWEVRETLTAYLYGAARNRALNHLRHERTARRWEERAVDQSGEPAAVSQTPDALDHLEFEEATATLQRAIAALPERARAVVVLRWQHQLRYAEIAEAMGISVKGVENQLARAKKALREGMGA